MKILGIEASGLVASTALWEDGVLRAEYTVNNKLTHSQTLLPMTEDMLNREGTALSELDAIAVSAGPGSFTGLRIGAATAKGLALALDLPVISVSSLRALRENLAETDGVIVPIMDARRGQVYCGAWQGEQALFSEQALPVEELLALLGQSLQQGPEELKGCCVTFLGDGVPPYREKIEAGADFRIRFASGANGRQRAASTAQLGGRLYAEWLSECGLSAREAKALGALELERRGLFTETVMLSDRLTPSYLRKPQAEREKEAGLLEDAGQKSLRKIARGDK